MAERSDTFIRRQIYFPGDSGGVDDSGGHGEANGGEGEEPELFQST